MASDSVSNMVFLVVSLVVAASVGGIVIQYSQRVSSSIEREGSDLSDQIQTDISIVNDPEYMTEEVSGENNLVLYVKNVGSRTLEENMNVVDIFVDGDYIPSENVRSFEVLEKNIWRPSSVAKILTNYTLNSGDHKATVRISSKEDSIEFIID